MIRLLQGDCRTALRALSANSVHTCVTSPPYFRLRSYLPAGHPDKAKEIGLEDSLEEYVATMVDVFREVRRVLHPTGTVWINLGDSFAGSWGNYGARNGKQRSRTSEYMERPAYEQFNQVPPTVYGSGLKPKDLMGVPWRVAFALQSDGWWLRSEIIWAKPNPMPEGVTDRPTRAHEYIFLLAKQERYFYDCDAVREPYNEASLGRYETPIASIGSIIGARQPGRDWNPVNEKIEPNPLGRNRRTVWTIATRSFPESHFATFPPDLVEPCIKAGTSEKGCCPNPACLAPWRRVVERTGYVNGRDPAHAPNNCPTKTDSTGWAPVLVGTNKWEPSCQCNAGEPQPCTVLDPFAGAATTLLVADRLGRNSIGLELSPSYVQMAMRRLKQDCPMFAAIEVEHAG